MTTFQKMYLTAMKDQAPKTYKSLSKSGQLLAHANQKAQEAAQMFEDLTANAPRDENGRIDMAREREAEEIVRAAMLEFPENEANLRTTAEEDEMNYLLGRRLT